MTDAPAARPRLFADPVSAQDRFSRCAPGCRRRSRRFWRAGRARISMRNCARAAATAQIRAARRAALRQRQHPYRPRAQQDPEGHGGALAADGGQGFQLCPRLGLPRPADRMEGRGGILPQEGQGQARLQGSGRDHRVPQGMPRLCRALALGAARGVQAARRRRRLGPSLLDDELSPPKRRSRARSTNSPPTACSTAAPSR